MGSPPKSEDIDPTTIEYRETCERCGKRSFTLVKWDLGIRVVYYWLCRKCDHDLQWFVGFSRIRHPKRDEQLKWQHAQTVKARREKKKSER